MHLTDDSSNSSYTFALVSMWNPWDSKWMRYKRNSTPVELKQHFRPVCTPHELLKLYYQIITAFTTPLGLAPWLNTWLTDQWINNYKRHAATLKLQQNAFQLTTPRFSQMRTVKSPHAKVKETAKRQHANSGDQSSNLHDALTWKWGCRGVGRICGWCCQPSACPKSHWWRCSAGWTPVSHPDCWWWPICHRARTLPRESYCSRARTPPPARRTGAAGLPFPTSVARTAAGGEDERRLWSLGCSLSCRSASCMLFTRVKERRRVPCHSPCAALTLG